MAERPALTDLLVEYDRALNYTDALCKDLSEEQIQWRPHVESSAVGWHLGHQAAVAHFMMRNLTAAEISLDPAMDALMDSATIEPARGDLPSLQRIDTYRHKVATRVRETVAHIDSGEVGAPAQLRRIAEGMLTSIINHEYQHSKWIGETRVEQFNLALPPQPESLLLIELDGYLMLA